RAAPSGRRPSAPAWRRRRSSAQAPCGPPPRSGWSRWRPSGSAGAIRGKAGNPWVLGRSGSVAGGVDVAVPRREAGDLEEVGKQGMAVLGGDAFGVELDAMHRMLLVLQPHDEAVGGPGGDRKAAGQAFALDDQRVIARDLEPLG